MSKKLIALLMAAMMLLSFAACGNEPAPAPTPDPAPAPSTDPAPAPAPTPDAEPVDPDAEKYGGDLVTAESNVSSTMDPHMSGGTTGNMRWMNHVFETLAVMDADSTIYGEICDFEQSADGLTYTFTLRDRHFSNGDKITMEDIEASLRRAIALSITTESTYNKYFKDSTWTFTEDKLTISFESLNLNFPGSLCSYVGSYRIIPKEICEKYPFTGGTATPQGFVWGAEGSMINEEADVIGSGPYTLTKWAGESEIKVTRNENYEIITEGNEEAFGVAAPKKAYFDTITFSINTDAASRTAGMMAGDYQLAMIQDSMAEAAKALGIIGEADGTTWTYGFFFNLDESNADSPVADVNFRKAIRAAIDCNACMLAVTGGSQDRVHLDPYGMVNSTPYASTIMEDSGEWNVADLEKAKAYLAQSNYNGETIYWLTPSSGNYYNIAMAAIPQLEAIGIKVELQIVDSGSHTSMRGKPETGHDIGGWIAQQRADNPVLHSTYVTSTNGWWTSDAKDAAIATMKSTPTGSAESIAAYEDFLQAVVDECPYIILGRADTLMYRWPEVTTDFNGSIIYYWNSYLTK